MEFIGIDKTIVKNFTAIKVDMDKLNSEGNTDNVMCLRYCQNKYNYFLENREDNFNLIKIKDNTMFNTLKIDVKKVGNNNFIQYAMLDMSIRQEGSNNLVPLTVDAYRQKIKAVFKYIGERYGIMCDISNLKFENIELNATLELDQEFNNYIRALSVLILVAPHTYKNRFIMINHVKNKVNQLEISNKSLKAKFYDKGEQLQEVYELDTHKNILRVEYTILTAEKMQDIFNHNELNKLTDQDIKQFIKSQFEKDFISRYNKFRDNSFKSLIKLAKQFQANNKQWIKPFLLHLINIELETKRPLLMDMLDLKDVVKALDKAHYSRNWKQIEKSCPTAFKDIDIKIQEIFNKIKAIE